MIHPTDIINLLRDHHLEPEETWQYYQENDTISLYVEGPNHTSGVILEDIPLGTMDAARKQIAKELRRAASTWNPVFDDIIHDESLSQDVLNSIKSKGLTVDKYYQLGQADAKAFKQAAKRLIIGIK